MKRIEIARNSVVRPRVGGLCALLLVLVPLGAPALAQEPGPAQPLESQPAAPLLTPDQLDNLVAPVALYPDALLSQVLVASTYPLEIAEASQWRQQNSNLQGQQLLAAARQQNWDPSVQALVALPDVLGRLASDIGWTSDLGNAFLAQQADVMNAVQRMRAQAQASGKLASDPQQTVVTQSQGGQTVIEIVPANPQVIYVPQYNPEYIWGPPAFGYYPPLYYPPFGFGFDTGIYIGSYFGGWGGWGWGLGGWGWGPNWFACSIVQNPFFFNHYGFRNYYGGYGGVWAHNPYHRMGVPYSNQRLASRFGGNYIGRGGVAHSASGGPRAASLGGGFRGTQMRGNAQSFAAQGNRGTAGNWRSFGNANANGGQRSGALNSSRMQSSPVRSNSRSFGSQAGRASTGGWSHFNGSSAAPANRSGGFRSAASYGGGSAGRSTPAYRSAPSYGGGSIGRSAPAYRSAPSFGGSRSFGSSRPAYSGGSRSFGGGHSGGFSGGGGSHGGGGGGSHGGGGGGSHGGGGHGGRR